MRTVENFLCAAVALTLSKLVFDEGKFGMCRVWNNEVYRYGRHVSEEAIRRSEKSEALDGM
jgi:hypothetical protein